MKIQNLLKEYQENIDATEVQYILFSEHRDVYHLLPLLMEADPPGGRGPGRPAEGPKKSETSIKEAEIAAVIYEKLHTKLKAEKRYYVTFHDKQDASDSPWVIMGGTPQKFPLLTFQSTEDLIQKWSNMMTLNLRSNDLIKLFQTLTVDFSKLSQFSKIERKPRHITLSNEDIIIKNGQEDPNALITPKSLDINIDGGKLKCKVLWTSLSGLNTINDFLGIDIINNFDYEDALKDILEITMDGTGSRNVLQSIKIKKMNEVSYITSEIYDPKNNHIIDNSTRGSLYVYCLYYYFVILVMVHMIVSKKGSPQYEKLTDRSSLNFFKPTSKVNDLGKFFHQTITTGTTIEFNDLDFEHQLTFTGQDVITGHKISKFSCVRAEDITQYQNALGKEAFIKFLNQHHLPQTHVFMVHGDSFRTIGGSLSKLMTMSAKFFSGSEKLGGFPTGS